MLRTELRQLLPLVALPFVLATAGNVEAQSKAKAKAEEPTVTVTAGVTFSADERAFIQGWFHDHPSGNVKALPPGIRKNLARGKPLPPGIAKQALPGGLSGGLPLMTGYERIQVGLDVLLVEVATGIIHDILMDVIR